MADAQNRTFVVAHSVVGPVMPGGDRPALPPRYRGETFNESDYTPETIARLSESGAIKDTASESGQAIVNEGVNPAYAGGLSIEAVFPHLVAEATQAGQPLSSIDASGAAALGIAQTASVDTDNDGVPDAPRRGPGRPAKTADEQLPQS